MMEDFIRQGAQMEREMRLNERAGRLPLRSAHTVEATTAEGEEAAETVTVQWVEMLSLWKPAQTLAPPTTAPPPPKGKGKGKDKGEDDEEKDEAKGKGDKKEEAAGDDKSKGKAKAKANKKISATIAVRGL